MKAVVVKAKSLVMVLVALVACLVLAFGGGSTALAGVYFGQTVRKVPIYCVDTEQKQVAISFDAAWGADKTQGICDTLSSYGANATFFLVGFWVDEYEDMVKTISNLGFEIGTHSNTHPDMVKLSQSQMQEELQTSISKITAITGKDVNLFRAPFGSYNNQLLQTAEDLGLKTIQWDVDTLDWKGLSATDILARVLKNVKNGSIILMHNNSNYVLQALPLLLDNLQKKGYKIVSVGDLIYETNFYIDSSGMQHLS